jgi:hypothetical protein
MLAAGYESQLLNVMLAGGRLVELAGVFRESRSGCVVLPPECSGDENITEILEELCWEGWWGRATIRQRLKRLSCVLVDS